MHMISKETDAVEERIRAMKKHVGTGEGSTFNIAVRSKDAVKFS